MADARVLLGDCRAILQTLESNSLEALVTDPPAGIAFMGKAWDSYESLNHFQQELTLVFREAMRVLKPGAHGLVWALPRTSMFTGIALIDAGFEVRDSIVHLFGSGMPKGLNISKAIDKAAGATREVVGPSRRHGGGASPIYAQDDWTQRNAATMGMHETAPATDEAKRWEGWNTTLKPAHEIWWLVRKPLSAPSVVKQVLKTGTGALNIEGCRVSTTDNLNGGAYSSQAGYVHRVFDNPLNYGCGEYKQPTGRWPANAMLSHAEDCGEACSDDCAVAALDEQSGFLVGAGNVRTSNCPTASTITYGGGWNALDRNPNYYSNAGGGASRFFYTSKVSSAERKLPDGTTNQHPTAKSLKLMRYLVRLVTPPKGTILDPFAGSGTTGVAALHEGFSFVGIEQDPEHHRIAELRLEHATARSNVFDELEKL